MDLGRTLRNKLNRVLYIVSGPGMPRLLATLTFEYADQDLTVRKTIQFDNTYVVQVETSVLDKGSHVSALPMWPAGFGDENSPPAYAAAQD